MTNHCGADVDLDSKTDRTERVFTHLMLCGKVRAAMRWRSMGRVLFPSDSVTMSIDNSKQTMSVIDALKYKHPPSHSPYSTTLPLPPFLFSKILM